MESSSLIVGAQPLRLPGDRRLTILLSRAEIAKLKARARAERLPTGTLAYRYVARARRRAK